MQASFDPNGTGKFSEEFRIQRADSGETRWIYNQAQTYFSGQGKTRRPVRNVGTVIDITDRKYTELNFAFLSLLQKDLGEAMSAADVMRIAGAHIASYLNLTHCLFVEIDSVAENATVLHDHVASDSPSLAGTYRLSDFHAADERRLLSAGQAIAIHDTTRESQTPAAAQFAALGIRSLITAPYLSAGRWKFSLSAQCNQARRWRKDEIDLLCNLTERIHTRIERVQAEFALQQSKEHFRTLFNSSEQGFCVFEILYGPNGNPVDYRFLEVNPTFEQHTGLNGAVGKTALELVPNLESFWIETYARVAETGEPHKFEQGSAAMGRQFEVEAVRVGEADSRRVALLFNDITKRKHSEFQLRLANERFRIAEAASNGFIYDLDLTTNEEVRSDGFQKVLGYSNDEFRYGGAEWEKLIHPDDVARVRTRTESLLANGESKASVEYRLRHKNGHWIWVMDEYVPVRNDDGRMQRIVGSIIDIGERKLAELDALFLFNLADQTAKSNNLDALIQSVTQAICEYFEASRCAFCEIDLAQGVAIVKHDHRAAPMPPLTGPYELSSYIAEDIAAFAAGKTVHHDDLRSDPRTAQFYESGYALLHIRSMLTSPLMRELRWVGLLVVTHHEPRVWTSREVALLRTVAERTWLALENVRLQTEMHALNASLELRVAERTSRLRESQTQLRKLSAYVERLREEERTRIAREVHDQLGGSLTVLKMSLAHAIRGLDKEVSSSLQDVQHQIDALVQTVRRIASDLRPPLLDDFGLIAALDWQTREWEKRTGIKSTLAMPTEDVPLDRERRTAVFRVFQESLTNIARHAHATQVDVNVETSSDHLLLTIKDNGAGIPAEALLPGQSLGLLGMHERIREVSGELDISGQPGQGTTVTIKVPFSRMENK